MPAAVTQVATGSVAAANAVGAHLGGASGAQLVSAAHSAYVTAMADGMRVAAAVAIVAAIASHIALRRPAPAPVRTPARPVSTPIAPAARPALAANASSTPTRNAHPSHRAGPGLRRLIRPTIRI